MEKKFYKKKTFFTEKNINENVKNIYISFQKYIFTQKMFVLQIKYKSFSNIYSFCKKRFFDHKKYLLKLCCELNNLVFKVSEAANLWYSLN